MSEKWNVYESFQALLEAGPYHLALEGMLLAWVVWLLVAAKSRPRQIKLTKKEEEQLLAEWTPEPLLSTIPDPDHPALHPRTVKGKLGHYVELSNSTDGSSGQKLLNLASHDYLQLSARPSLEDAALTCLHKYGVGSCGPRGFYGTTEVHLQLEQRLADFYNCEAAVLYSYGFSTVASAIPAYAKSGDIIFADESVSFPILRGLQASRSRLVFFRHNDPQHLRSLLQQQASQDRKNPKKASATRRFLVVEGLYYNTGQVCPLPELVALREEFKLRLFIDETCSFGTLGEHARGVTDHFKISLTEVDLIIGSLEYSGGSTGGFCAGTKFVVEHQRLSGLGYCFSASLPPMLAAAAIQMLAVLEDEGGALVSALQDRCQVLHKQLDAALPAQVVLSGDVISPVKLLRFAVDEKDEEGEDGEVDEEQRAEQQHCRLRRVVEEAERRGIALVTTAPPSCSKDTHSPAAPPSSPTTPGSPTTPVIPAPAIRLTVNVKLTDEEIASAVVAIKEAFTTVLQE